MIKLNLFRNAPQYIVPYSPKPFVQNIEKQLLENIKYEEGNIQTILLSIKDKPIFRKIVKGFELPDDTVKIPLRCYFSEYGKNIQTSKSFTAEFSGKEFDMIEGGRNLAAEKGSFLNDLIEKINNLRESKK